MTLIDKYSKLMKSSMALGFKKFTTKIQKKFVMKTQTGKGLNREEKFCLREHFLKLSLGMHNVSKWSDKL